MGRRIMSTRIDKGWGVVWKDGTMTTFPPGWTRNQTRAHAKAAGATPVRVLNLQTWWRAT